MKRHISAAISVTALFVVLLTSILTARVFSAQAAASSSMPASAMSFVENCPPATDGQMTCLSLRSTTIVAPTFAKLNNVTALGAVVPNAKATGSKAPYGPTALHNAYNLPLMAPTPQTVAIIDAFDDPNAEKDMNTYRQMFAIPACTTANGCFKKVDQTGGTVFPTPNAGWAGEISLDLDMVSAVCQNCHIVLVEANAPTLADLGAAENEAVALGANEISNSFGGPEKKTDKQGCSQFFNHPGVVITASSGDAGSPDVEKPANCPNVVSVGGTTLNPNGTETAWNTNAHEGAGGGCSAVIGIPAWQQMAVSQGKVTTDCTNRAIADVAAVADPATGLLVVDTFQQKGNGMIQAGGTSASAPIIAAVYALAGGAQSATSASGAIIPWTQVINGKQCLNTVGAGYAFQTGLGTPNGTTCF